MSLFPFATTEDLTLADQEVTASSTVLSVLRI